MDTTSALSTEILPAAIRLITHELMPTVSPRRQRTYAQVTRVLERAQREIERRRRQGALPPMTMGIPAPTSAEDMVAWGRMLRKRREEAGLTRIELANISNVADSTIRNLETGRHKPTRAILMRLQAVPALGMPSPFAEAPFARHEEEASAPSASFACNCWFAPEYDSIKMARDMVQRLNGSGGHIEQTYLYIDPASAAAWCACTEQDAWARAKAATPMHDIAKSIMEAGGTAPFDILALGPGEAIDEVRLVQNLVDEGAKNMRLFLLEISQPMLSAGYQHAAQVLGDVPAVGVYAIQGNFHNLPNYTQLFEAQHRRRLVTMFGYTFSNLENEVLFLRNSLRSFTEGDLLLLDGPKACAPTSEPEEIMRKDPRLAKALPSSLSTAQARLEEFYKGPFKRHVTGLRSIKLDTVLDLDSCAIPGSYAVDWRAYVRTDRGPDREFSIYRTKRYNPELLDACMAQYGWQQLKRWVYAEEHHPRLLSLYRRMPSLPLGRGRGLGHGGGKPKSLE